jgi:hypothetical protein
MNRREALRNVAILMGAAVSASTLSALEGCNPKGPDNYALQAPETKKMFAEVVDTIIPKTDTPGAKEAGVGDFIATMLNDCYKPEDQKTVLDGLKKIDEASQQQFKKSFVDLTPDQRTTVLTAIDKERDAYNKRDKKSKDDPTHYFHIIKELTLLGYFTSKPGASQALRYVPVPGKFEGCIPYNKGDKAWAM